jgi:hypothetical protein
MGEQHARLCTTGVGNNTTAEDGRLPGCYAVVVWWKFTDVSEVLAAFIISYVANGTRAIFSETV